MNINNITKGYWDIQRNFTLKVGVPGDLVAGIFNTPNREDNAQLICEAGNVANETGLSPRELLKQRDELLKALKIAMRNWQIEPEGDRDFNANEFKEYRECETILYKY